MLFDPLVFLEHLAALVPPALSNYWADAQVSNWRELAAVVGSRSRPWRALIGPKAECEHISPTAFTSPDRLPQS